MEPGGGGTMSSSNGCGEVLNYEEVYLHAHETIHDAQVGIASYIPFYNQIRPPRALDGRMPDRVYCHNRPARPTAA